MNVCGIELAGHEARLVVIVGTPNDWVLLDSGLRRVSLEDIDSTAEVKSFREIWQAFVDEQHVTHIVIKKRALKGEYAGGPVSFKMEGVLQTLDRCEVCVLSPLTIAAHMKKEPVNPPESLKKYQHEAFKAAYAFLKG